jgi:hypothetical protein
MAMGYLAEVLRAEEGRASHQYLLQNNTGPLQRPSFDIMPWKHVQLGISLPLQCDYQANLEALWPFWQQLKAT